MADRPWIARLDNGATLITPPLPRIKLALEAANECWLACLPVAARTAGVRSIVQILRVGHCCACGLQTEDAIGFETAAGAPAVICQDCDAAIERAQR